MLNFGQLFQTDNTDYQAIIEQLNKGEAQLVDIRERNEWENGHFQGAIHIPLSGLSRGVGIDQLKKLKNANKKIFLHCLSGSRVQLAKQMLAGFGCTEIAILPTSMNVMSRHGFQLV
jgi:rhodanese-related sulfurtransferase